jgi:hypothetical protein
VAQGLGRSSRTHAAARCHHDNHTVSALDAAHAISVIHGGVKPSNARYNAVTTALPAVLPVAANQPTTVAVNPIDQLRALLVSGDTYRQISMGGDALIAKLDTAQGALAQNDKVDRDGPVAGAAAADQWCAQRHNRARDVTSGADRVDAIARSDNLTLPFSVTSG